MYDFPYDPAGDPRHPRSACGPRRGGLLRMVLVAVAVGVVLSLLIGPVFWALGLAFHLFTVVIRLALLVAIGTFVWRHLLRGHIGRRGI